MKNINHNLSSAIEQIYHCLINYYFKGKYWSWGWWQQLKNNIDNTILMKNISSWHNIITSWADFRGQVTRRMRRRMMMDSSSVGWKRQSGSLYRHILSESCQSPNLEILSAPWPDANKKSKFGLGHQAICCGVLEAHSPKSPKTGLGGVACGQGLRHCP